MILSGFKQEQQLIDWYEEGAITALQYIEHHSPEMVQRFMVWCKEAACSEGEDAAQDFLDEYNGLFLDTVVSKNAEVSESHDELFVKWCEDKAFLDKLFQSKEATQVALWRYKNPCSLDKEKCALLLGITLNDAQLWWPIVEFLDFAHGGKFHPVKLSEEAISNALLYVCHSYI